MKRARLGDVYSIRLPNGYKLYQWAYTIPRKGDYIRVFDGLYQTIPDDIDSIVNGPHSYIISFYASRAYRIGLAQLHGNYPVPVQYPFPRFQIRFDIDGKANKVDRIHVMNSDGKRDVWQWYSVSRIENLPEEFQEITLINDVITPNWLLYLFDNGFDLQHPERFHSGPNPKQKLKKYTEMVNSCIEKSKSK